MTPYIIVRAVVRAVVAIVALAALPVLIGIGVAAYLS